MRRDSIFYYLLQQTPSVLRDLVPNPPENVDRYRFDSVAIKEPRFEIDGVFLPPEDSPGPVFFVEVQFQKDERLYERIFAEAFLYFYRLRDRFTDWQLVVIYPSRRTEQGNRLPYSDLLSSDRVHRIYLEEMNIEELPPWVGLMVLTTVEKAQATEEAKKILDRTKAESPSESRAILDAVVRIMSYRFGQISREEVERMLDISVDSFKETRVYRDLKELAEEEARAEVRQEVREEGRQEGREEGRKEEASNLLIRQLSKRFTALSENDQAQISVLSIDCLEALSEALLDFKTLSDLQEWLSDHAAADN